MSYVFIRKSTTRAKRRHVCIWCGQRVEVGESYERVIGTFEGDLQSDAYHPECRVAAEAHFDEEPDGFYPHENERPEPLPA